MSPASPPGCRTPFLPPAVPAAGVFPLVLALLGAILGCAGSPSADRPEPVGIVTAVYRSASGATLTALLCTGNDSVTITLPDGRRTRLRRTISGSGARYSAGSETFWEHHGEGSYWKGETLLFRGTAGE